MNLTFELGRAERLKNDLEKLIVRERVELSRYSMKPGRERDGYCCALDGSWTECTLETPWTALDEHRWYRTEVEIPQSMDGAHVEFVISTGREGQWDATNPQMLLYVNGALVEGLDVNHRAVTLSASAQAGERFAIAFLAYSGSVPGDLVMHSWLEAVDDRVRKLYYDLLIPIQSAMLLKRADQENYRRILQKLSPALDALDLRQPYSARFYASVDAADGILREAFYTKVDGEAPVVSAIGHTHIDIAWLWTVEQTREKVLRSFSTVLHLMDLYPDYKFMSSQPVLYQFVKEQEPEMYERIKERIREGRWEVDGAMWLEADCNLTGGESLVRQIIKGHRFIKEEFGKESKSLWLPDVFGYSAAIPQILKRSGIPYFMTTKISWNQYNQLPNDTFVWRGLDGSEVFTFMPTTKDFDQGQGLNISYSDTRNTTTYTGIINPNMTLGTFKRFQNRDLTEDTLMLFGFGDGGGGPTREMLESAERLKYGMPGIPRIQLETEQAYFDRTSKKIQGKPDMPTWDGELYFEYHRGTLSSMAKNKRGNRKNELLYEQLETAACLAGLENDEALRRTAAHGWDVLMLNQFHDILPGSSIEPVYKVTDGEYAEIAAAGSQALARAAQTAADGLAMERDGFAVLNTQGYDRSDVVCLAPEQAAGVTALCDAAGASVPLQRTADGGLVFYAEQVPGLGFKRFYLAESACRNGKTGTDGGDAAESQAKKADAKAVSPGRTEFAEENSSAATPAWNGVFENAFYRAVFNEHMELTSLYEKRSGKELMREGQRGNVLCTYEDRPMQWDNWDVDVFYKKKPYQADWYSAPKVVEDGPVRTVLAFSCGFLESVVHQQVILYHALPRIDFKTTAEWKEHHVLLKVHFPVAVNALRASYEVQFGNVERETTNNTSWDTAKFEACGHKWADLSENSAGLSLLNDCKYGYGIKNGDMSLTLVKAGTYPNQNADIGTHEFTYSIYPHAGRWQEAQTVEQAYNLNVPLLTLRRSANVDGADATQVCGQADTGWLQSETGGTQAQTAGQDGVTTRTGWPADGASFLRCSGESCFVEVLKPAEDGQGVIVRMYENKNNSVHAALRTALPLKAAYECDLLERNEQLLTLDGDGHGFRADFHPYEIKTFRLLFA